MKLSDETGRIIRRGVRTVIFPVLIVAVSLCVVFAAVAAVQITDYEIRDGDEVIAFRSTVDDPENLLAEKGVDMENAWYICSEEDGTVIITVRRNYNITVSCDGTDISGTAEDGTVIDALESFGIVPGDEDIISSGPEDRIYEGMEITVTRVYTRYSAEDVETSYNTVYVDDPDSYEGVSRVVTEGSEGMVRNIYASVYVDGVLSGTDLYGTEVLEEPVTEVIAVGTKKASIPEGKTAAVDEEAGVIVSEAGEVFPYSRVISMTATAYTYHSGENITYSGEPAAVGIVAALPSTIPQGSRVYIVSPDGTWEYGFAVVGDRPARNILDLFMETYDECIQFGVSDALVYVLDGEED